jgi:hypothetical protein
LIFYYTNFHNIRNKKGRTAFEMDAMEDPDADDTGAILKSQLQQTAVRFDPTPGRPLALNRGARGRDRRGAKRFWLILLIFFLSADYKNSG